MPEPRTETLSFRLTASERQMIDTEARRLGLENSEFARRVLLEAAIRSAKALDDARSEARAEVREESATRRSWHRDRGSRGVAKQG